MMMGRQRAGVGGACLAAALGLSLVSATAQVPDLPVPPDPSTVPTTVAPPEGDPPPVPAPTQPPAPTETVPPGTPVNSAPMPTTTTFPANKQATSATQPPRTIEGAAPAAFGLDLSEIDALRRQARGRGPRAPEPDFGFDSDLPFQPGTQAIDGPQEDALELGAEAEEIAQVRSASAVAAGLLALLLVGFAVWALRQARPARSPDESSCARP